MVELLIPLSWWWGTFQKDIALFPFSSSKIFLHCSFRVQRYKLMSLIHTAHGPPAELTFDYSWLLLSLTFANMFSDSEWSLPSSCISALCWGLENYIEERACNILCLTLRLGNTSCRLWHIKWGTGNDLMNTISKYIIFLWKTLSLG